MRKMKSFARNFIVLAISATIGSAALASAPMVGPRAAGYFRFKLGDFEITSLSDGTVDLPMGKLLTNISPQDLQKTLAQRHLTDPTESSDIGYLINTGTKLVLVDTGAGQLFGPTLGKLVASLQASGYQPEQVDDILITHMHPDHVGGLVKEGKLIFPNAVIHADKAESDFWLSEENMNKAPADAKGFFQGAMASLNPYVKAGKYQSFSADSEIVPGIHTLSSHGHTAGHTTYVVESKGQKLALIGDLVHLGAVQFHRPMVAIHFDTDQKSAQQERLKAFNDAAKNGYLIGAAHLPFPGVGYLAKEGKAFEFLPINYTR